MSPPPPHRIVAMVLPFYITDHNVQLFVLIDLTTVLQTLGERLSAEEAEVSEVNANEINKARQLGAATVDPETHTHHEMEFDLMYKLPFIGNTT